VVAAPQGRYRTGVTDSDGLIGIETPWKRLDDGGFIASDWVRREFTYAVDQRKPAIALVHHQVVPSTAFTHLERIELDPTDTAKALLKLIRTINEWKRQTGRSFEVELGPTTIVDRLNDEDEQHRCEYRLMREHDTTPWQRAKFWHDVGGAFAYLRSIPDDVKIQVRITLGAERWRSRFGALVSRVTLEREPD
jgi:hypothetical protein